MRIVPNLNDVDECPNCESRGLISNHNKFGRLYRLCPVCHEEIYENETTCSEEKAMIDNLDNIHYCPKCMSSRLTTVTDIRSLTKYKHCNSCGHTIYPSNEQSPLTEHKIDEEWVSLSKKKEDFIFEMREEISHLDWCSHDLKTQTLVENIQNILNKIIDYIEEN